MSAALGFRVSHGVLTMIAPPILRAYAGLAHEKNITLIIDKIYCDFIMTGELPHGLFSSAAQRPWQSTLHPPLLVLQVILPSRTPPQNYRGFFITSCISEIGPRHIADLHSATHPTCPCAFTPNSPSLRDRYCKAAAY
ncbi:hypothetical protein BDZ97DRAFT_1920723 [Flammula alnicola]|nr:hypothetical protein BDZ97DRAFT_1920723 [Flammula alnicola]